MIDPIKQSMIPEKALRETNNSFLEPAKTIFFLDYNEIVIFIKKLICFWRKKGFPHFPIHSCTV